jgi:hypothetical protein
VHLREVEVVNSNGQMAAESVEQLLAKLEEVWRFELFNFWLLAFLLTSAFNLPAVARGLNGVSV